MANIFQGRRAGNTTAVGAGPGTAIHTGYDTLEGFAVLPVQGRVEPLLQAINITGWLGIYL